MSVDLHTGAGLSHWKNWQLLSSAGQWLTSQRMPFVIGGDFYVEPKQLEDSGCVQSAGFAVAPKLATVTPSHRVIDFFVDSRDFAGVCEAGTEISKHIAPHRPDNIAIFTRLLQPKKLVMNRPKSCPLVRPIGCNRPGRDLDWDVVQLDFQEAVGAHALWSALSTRWMRSS